MLIGYKMKIKILSIFACTFLAITRSALAYTPDSSIPYIQSNGNQYINTGVPSRTGVKIELDIEFTQIQNDFAIAGARSGDKRFYLLHLNNGYLAFGAGAFYYINANDPTVVNDSVNNPTNYKINANQRYKLVSDFSEGQQTISVDGSVVYAGNHADGINLDMDFYLLAVNQDGYDKYNSVVKLYSVKIWLDGVLVRYYVPDIRDGTSGFYDLVNGTFNVSPKGNFVVTERSLKGAPDCFVDWIAGNQKACMDLGVLAASDIVAEGSMMWTYLGSAEEFSFLGRKGNNGVYMVMIHTIDSDAWVANNFVKGTIGDVLGDSSKEYKYQPNVLYNFRAVSANGEQSLTINGEKIYELNAEGDFAGDKNLMLFAFDQGAYCSYSRCYGLKIWSDGVLVRDFRPAVKNGEGVLWDAVSDTCFFSWEGIKGKYIGKPLTKANSPRYNVEYLGSANSQWIDSGVIGKSGTKVEADIAWIRLDSDCGLIGSRISASSDSRFYPIHTYNNELSFGYVKFVYTKKYLEVGRRYKIVSDNKKDSQTIYVDDQLVYSDTRSDEIDTAYPMYIFAENVAGVASYYSSARIYSMKIWQDDVLVRNFVPVLADNMEPGFYDTVEQKLYVAQSISGLWDYGQIVSPYFNSTFIVIR
jgi:hypothetical protein